MTEREIVTTRASVNFVDETIRDGNQSLWDATGITTPMILSIAPIMDRVGFKSIILTASTLMRLQVRMHHENPWDSIRLVAKAMPRTPLTFLTTGRRFMTFTVTPFSVMVLVFQRMIANGIRRIWILDTSHAPEATFRMARMAKAAGAEEVVGSLIYSISPVHNDEFYAQKAREIAKCPDIDAIMIEDVGGLLTPERTRTLVPLIQQNIGELPFELHAHCNTGLAPICYLEAIKLGVRTIWTCVSPLANGTSLPSTENILKNIRRLGYSANLDEEALGAMAAHFRGIAERESRPLGAPLEHDVYYYEHQIPGGMVTTLKRQLSEIGMEYRLDEILEEAIRVRKELGYPIMVTPFSQFVVTQATHNITTSERYKVVPQGVIQYVAGWFGKPPASIDQSVLDKISSLPQAKSILNTEPPEPSIQELRQKIGAGLSDDEFLLRLALTDEEIKGLHPIKTQYP